MALQQVSETVTQQERDQYLEDLAIEREDDRLAREHEIQVLKLTEGLNTKYKTVQAVLVSLVKLIPYCVALTGVIILTLVKRDIPASLERFLKG